MVRETADTSGIPSGWRTRLPGNIVWGVLCALRVVVHMTGVSIVYVAAHRRPDRHWTYGQAVRSTFIRLATAAMSQIGAMDSIDLRPGKLGDRWVVIQPSADDSAYMHSPLLHSTTVKAAAIGATWYPRLPTDEQLRCASTKIVLWFHSGSFIYLSGRPGDSGTAATLLNDCLDDATNYLLLERGDGVPATVAPHAVTFSLWVQYRLAGSLNNPTPYPGPMQDALTAYLYLVRQLCISPSRIIVGGDSSGGTMAVGLLRYLVEPAATPLSTLQPLACVLLSPSVDYGVEGDLQELEANRNALTDCVDLPMLAWATAVFAPPPVELTSPYLSPARHPFRTPVALFVQAGGNEVLCDSIRSFVHAMKRVTDVRGGNRVEFFELPYAPHDVFALGHLIGWRKEARQVCQLAAQYIVSLVAAATAKQTTEYVTETTPTQRVGKTGSDAQITESDMPPDIIGCQ